MGFGVGERFDEDERIKWEKKILIYNKSTSKPLKVKSDPQPGPQHYSLINHWPGKIVKMKSKKVKEEERNFLSKISKGVVINPYYRKI